MFWLTNAEQENAVIQAQIQQEAVEYRKRKYTVAVFNSGKSALISTTEGLLLHNQKVLARRNLECVHETEEAGGMFMSM